MEKVIIALGYFDSVHKGHEEVIVKAKALAQKLKIKTAVLTFDKDLSYFFGKGGSVFTFSEREKRLKDLGANYIVKYPVNKTYLSKGKKAFLNYLNSLYDIKGYVFGEDFTFGKNAKGNIDYIKTYAKEKGQLIEVVPFKEIDGKKISTTMVKEYLIRGEIEKANSLLTLPYEVTSKVIRDRGIGKSLGFPTANLLIDDSKINLKNGVYCGYAYINGKRYKGIINYGNRPTFGLNKVLVEVHFKNFNDNLYGKTLTVYFEKFIRDIKKFSSIEELKSQITKDLGEIDND